jgi:peptide/nickel transport system ATP-binding protein
VEYPSRQGVVHAATEVDLHIARGETLGLVGESGCGKSTVARAIAQLPRPTAGTVDFDGVELTALRGRELRLRRREFSFVFQDPTSSLNPRRRVQDIVSQPLRIAGVGRDERRAAARDLLQQVGIDPNRGDRYPHEFSGGQCQRISIARALASQPRLLICDEPVSALDVSVQAQIINLLQEASAERQLAMLFVSHDLSVVRKVADRVAVMYLGRLGEVAPSDRLYTAPAHPYSRALLDAIPLPDPGRRDRTRTPLTGELPSPRNPPSGCRFRTRCPLADERCAAEVPALREIAEGHLVACHHPLVREESPAPLLERGAT